MKTSKKRRKKSMQLSAASIARIILFILFCITMIFYFSACKPVEKIVVKKEYVSQLKYDSIYLQKHDSIYMYSKGDTVFIERFKTEYKNRFKLLKDTVYRTDTLIFKQPPDKIEVPVEVNKWGFLDWVGLITLIAGAVLLAINLLTKPFLKYINQFNK